MAKAEKATVAMFDDIYPLLQELNSDLPRAKWRLIFDYPWRPKNEDIGYVLRDGGKVVGFIGTLFSRRIIDGKEARLCHLTSWIVKEEYRGESLRLLLPLLKLRDCALNAIDLNYTACAILKRLGFTELDSNLRLLFPVPRLGWTARKNRPVITSDHSTIATLLNPVDMTIFNDHLPYDCGHLVVRDGDGYCYIVFTRKHRIKYNLKFPYLQIHYISNRNMFLKHVDKIKLHLLKLHKCWFLAVDERFIGNDPIPFSKVYQLKIPRMYKSELLTSAQIDNLYTELVVLGL